MPQSDKFPLYVIAHNIRSMHNVGAIFRSADCFGVDKVFLTGYTGTPPDSRISKVALGAEEYLPWEASKSLVRLIKKLKVQMPELKIAVLENNVKYEVVKIHDYSISTPLALILGEETKGNTKKILDLADIILEIPMQGQKESLNVSVAAGIAMYALKNGNKN